MTCSCTRSRRAGMRSRCIRRSVANEYAGGVSVAGAIAVMSWSRSGAMHGPVRGDTHGHDGCTTSLARAAVRARGGGSMGRHVLTSITMSIIAMAATGCYSGTRAAQDINLAWRGHARVELEAKLGV